GRWPAVTTREAGQGRITYIGTVPDQELAAALMDWAVQVGSGEPSWRPASKSQTVFSSTNGAGERVHVIHNWSWEPSTYPLSSPVRDVLSGQELPEGAELEFVAWDVRVV